MVLATTAKQLWKNTIMKQKKVNTPKRRWLFHEDYFLGNIVGKYSCVDFEKSELELFEEGQIEFIDSLVLSVLDEDRVGHIFRLAEFPTLIIITQALKERLQESDITGFKIYRPKDFSL